MALMKKEIKGKDEADWLHWAKWVKWVTTVSDSEGNKSDGR
jgi:hypothetical protein